MQRQEKLATINSSGPLTYSQDDVSALVPPAFPQSAPYMLEPDPRIFIRPNFLYPPAATVLPPGSAAAAAAAGGHEAACNASAATYFPLVPPIGTTIAPSWGSAASTPVSQHGGHPASFSSPFSPPPPAAAAAAGLGSSLSTPFLGSITADPFLAYDMLHAERQVRHGFIRKVLGLIMLQLLLTVAVAAPVRHNKQVRHFLEQNPWALVLSSVVAVTVLIILACSEAARRTHPTNLILLGVFTATEGLLVGVASATYNTHVLVNALVWTVLAMAVMVLYALQTRVDFTSEGGTLYAALTLLLVVGIARAAFHVHMLDALMAGCGALVLSAYFIYDVQLTASSERFGIVVSSDEYVFATLSIYTDVINFFLYSLQLVQGVQPERE